MVTLFGRYCVSADLFVCLLLNGESLDIVSSGLGSDPGLLGRVYHEVVLSGTLQKDWTK